MVIVEMHEFASGSKIVGSASARLSKPPLSAVLKHLVASRDSLSFGKQ